MKKALSKIVVILLLLSLLGGCVLIKTNQAVEDKPYVLNERQIATLKEQGVSTNYEELRVEHRMAIRFIEEGLQYLEKNMASALSITTIFQRAY